jgi:cell shape-determining protein MreC
MRHHRFRRPSKPTVFKLLMLGAAVLMLLPTDLLAPLRNATQLLALPQLVARESGLQVTQRFRSIAASPVSPEQHELALREKAALENQNVSLHQQVTELQGLVEELAHTRRHGFPPQGVLIPARIIGLDAAAGRDSLIISKGRSRNVKMGDWVASRLFLEIGTGDGVREQLLVLAQECLIGWVEQVSPWASRVVLLTDVLANRAMPIRIASRENGLPLLADNLPVNFALRGAGHGKMVVSDIPREFVDAGQIRIDDLVVSDPANPDLPVSLVVGRITELSHNRKKPLYYDAVVVPPHDPKSLNRVLVVDMEGTALPGL